MVRHNLALRLTAIPQFLSGVLVRGLSRAERLQQLSDLYYVVMNGHVPESVFAFLDDELEESNRDGYIRRVLSATDRQLIKMLQLLMASLVKGGYRTSFATACREHFRGCDECQSQACGIVRSGAVMKSRIRDLFAKLPQQILSREASDKIIARLMLEIKLRELLPTSK
ncbi:MAG: hypothetical protein V1738_00665 [Patescibacteria group bacterium]